MPQDRARGQRGAGHYIMYVGFVFLGALFGVDKSCVGAFIRLLDQATRRREGAALGAHRTRGRASDARRGMVRPGCG